MADLIIGLSGKKRSGKDTFARGLVEHRGFTRVAFADPLKQLALHIDPLVTVPVLSHDIKAGEPFNPAFVTTAQRHLADLVAEFGWEAAKDEFDGVREVLKQLGVGVRGFDEAYWVRQAMETAATIDGPVVITDVRFPNEVDAIRDAGGKVIRVTRPGRPDDGDAHESETALDHWTFADMSYSNEGTVEDVVVAATRLDLNRLFGPTVGVVPFSR